MNDTVPTRAGKGRTDEKKKKGESNGTCSAGSNRFSRWPFNATLLNPRNDQDNEQSARAARSKAQENSYKCIEFRGTRVRESTANLQHLYSGSHTRTHSLINRAINKTFLDNKPVGGFMSMPFPPDRACTDFVDPQHDGVAGSLNA